jgi:hypothetical protein
VVNAGFVRSAPTDLVCAVDGGTLRTLPVPALDPRAEVVLDVSWRWAAGTHRFTARVDPAGAMDQISRKNDVLEFDTDAYVIDAVCERSIVAPIAKVNGFYGSFGFEDWMRGATVDRMNAMFRSSRYDFAPEGARISVRLGKIFLVDSLPDGDAGPLDRSLGLDIYDGTWHYPLRAIDEWIDLANGFDWALVHELTHQLGIIDDYQFDLGADGNKVNGKPFEHGNGGIMGGGSAGDNAQPAYADIDVAGMNLTRGHRRGYFGEYLFCLPEKNVLVLSAGGKPLADADVYVYQKDMDTGKVEGPAVHAGRTDAAGRFPLANRPVPKEYATATGCTLRPNPFGYPDVVGRNGLFLVRARSGSSWYYGFITIGPFVCEYARGHRDAGTCPLELKPE